VVIPKYPPAANQGLLVERQGLPVLASAPQVQSHLVEQPQPPHRLHIEAPAMIGRN
jgi:hypothetical protein